MTTIEKPQCGNAFNGEPCQNTPELFVVVSCSNPGCPTNDNVLLCKSCLIVVHQRGRTKCGNCGTGMILTSEPYPLVARS